MVVMVDEHDRAGVDAAREAAMFGVEHSRPWVPQLST